MEKGEKMNIDFGPVKVKKLTFWHTLTGDITKQPPEVRLDGAVLLPDRSQAQHNHSPDGFSWGYTGSGPSQLALALTLQLFDEPMRYHQVVDQLIAKLPFAKSFHVEFQMTGRLPDHSIHVDIRNVRHIEQLSNKE